MSDFLLSTDHFVTGQFLEFNQSFIGKGKFWCNGTYMDKSVEIYPGVTQHTPLYRDMLLWVHQELSSLPILFDPDKEIHYLSSVDQVLVDWGSLSGKILVPLENNEPLRSSKNLRSPTEEEKVIIRDFINRVINSVSFKSIHLKKISSCGFPYMQQGADLKMAMFSTVAQNVRNFVTLTALGEMEKRFEIFRSYPAYTNGIRVQADRVKRNDDGSLYTKQRYTFDLDKLKKGAYSEAMIPIPKDVFIEGKREDSLFSARVRSMYALSYHDNCLLQGWNNALHEGIKKVCDGIRYNGPEDLSAYLRERKRNHGNQVVRTLDKSEFGETFSPDVLQIFLEEFGKTFGEIWSEFIRRSIDAPVFLRGVEKGVRGVSFSRETVTKKENSLRGSFKSGHGLVAFLGELLGAIDALLIYRNICKELGETFSLEVFLRNDSPFFYYKGKGDDSLFVLRDKTVEKVFSKVVKNGASLHADELENGALFLGSYYTHSGQEQVDMARYIESSFGSERGWRSKTFPELGEIAKDIRYSTNPCFQKIRDIKHRALKKFYNFNLEEWTNRFRKKASSYTLEEMLLIADPDKAFYRDDLKEKVRPDVLKIHYEEVDASHIENLLLSV